jgi:hypothetical protein
MPLDCNGDLIALRDIVECIDDAATGGTLSKGSMYEVDSMPTNQEIVLKGASIHLWPSNAFMIKRRLYTTGYLIFRSLANNAQRVVQTGVQAMNQDVKVFNVGALTDAIVALINSKPRSPSRQEIEEAIKKCLPQ